MINIRRVNTLTEETIQYTIDYNLDEMGIFEESVINLIRDAYLESPFQFKLISQTENHITYLDNGGIHNNTMLSALFNIVEISESNFNHILVKTCNIVNPSSVKLVK